MRWAWVGLAAAVLACVLATVGWHSGETTAPTLAAVVAAVFALTRPLATWFQIYAAHGHDHAAQARRAAR